MSRIADWTPDRPPTPPEVVDAYQISGLTPITHAFFSIHASRMKKEM